KCPNDKSGFFGNRATTPLTSIAQSYDYDSRISVNSGQNQSPTSHQLPPLIQITLVAIDEISANRLHSFEDQESEPHLVPDILFKDPFQYENDLNKLEEILKASPGNLAQNKIPCQYQVFTVDVVLRSSRWKQENS
ncbi:MAG: hypothetical protein V4507_16365, partial [Verrucomicrobiota bacterium]